MDKDVIVLGAVQILNTQLPKWILPGVIILFYQDIKGAQDHLFLEFHLRLSAVACKKICSHIIGVGRTIDYVDGKMPTVGMESHADKSLN